MTDLAEKSSSNTSPAERRPRVLHVINGEHYSGAERVQDLLGLQLPDQGFDVGFVALKTGRFGDVRQSINTPLHELEMRGRWDLRVISKVMTIAKEGRYDLLHAHTPRSALIASIAAKRLGLPFVYHVHSPTSRDSTRWLANLINDRVERWSIEAAERLITVSPTLTDHMRSLGVAADKIRCVLNGVPEVPAAEPRETPTQGWTLGMVALFRPRKGAEVLLESLAQLRQAGHPVTLRAIGPFETESYEEEIISLCRKLDLIDAVQWTGFTQNVNEELAQTDALVLPSLFGEGLPMVVLEALAMGLPVVATRCEGVSQAVQDEQNGLLVEAGSVDQLTAALTRLLSPTRTGELSYPQLSKHAIASHRAGFSDKIMAANVAAVYRELLGGNAPANRKSNLAESSSTDQRRTADSPAA